MNPGDRLIVVGTKDDEPLFKGDGSVKPGDIVECESDTQKHLNDPGTEGEPLSALAPGADYRSVRVVVIEGSSKGQVGTIYRRHLRPAPK